MLHVSSQPGGPLLGCALNFHAGGKEAYASNNVKC